MNIGGPSKHVANLSSSLNNYGYKTQLLSGMPDATEGDMFELVQNSNTDLKIIPHLGRAINPINDFLAFIEIIKEIKRLKPDIVHTHTTKAGILGRAAALLCGVPHIYHTYHGHIFKGYFSNSITSLIVLIEKLFARFTTNLITLTPNLASEIKNILRLSNKNKIQIIPLGLELNKNLFTPRHKNIWRDKRGFSKNDFILGIVARLVPIKNHCLLIKTMKQLCKCIPNLKLAIIGSGELESQLKQQVIDNELTDNIIFTGNESEMEQVYSDLDLLVLCSKNEGTPVVIIEALASGCPVAATNVGGISEILYGQKYGYLLPTDSESFKTELQKIIVELINHKYESNFADRKSIADTYSVENLSNNLSKLYKINNS